MGKPHCSPRYSPISRHVSESLLVLFSEHAYQAVESLSSNDGQTGCVLLRFVAFCCVFMRFYAFLCVFMHFYAFFVAFCCVFCCVLMLFSSGLFSSVFPAKNDEFDRGSRRVRTFKPDLPQRSSGGAQKTTAMTTGRVMAVPSGAAPKPMDDSWKAIDLSDIVYKQTVVHEAIVGVLAGGSVTEDDAYVIDMKLKQAEVSASLRGYIAEGLTIFTDEPEEEEAEDAAPDAEAIKAAAKAGDASAVAALLAEGVAVDVQDSSGYTPLYHATMYGKENVVKLCITSGAMVDLENNNGVTPLMAAARDGVTAIVAMLLEAGADAYQVDEFGRTASSVAEEKGCEETSKFVQDWASTHAEGSHTSLIVKKPSGATPAGGGGGGGGGAGDDAIERLRSLCPPGFHRGTHGSERVYAQPLVKSVLRAALIGAKSPWQPETPGYVDDDALKLLGVPKSTRDLLTKAMTGPDNKILPEGKTLSTEDVAALRHLCSTSLDVMDLVAEAKKVIGVDLFVLNTSRPEKQAVLLEIFANRTACLSRSGGAAGVYGEPAAGEQLGVFACGCSIQNCVQCATDCDDWDRILCDLDESAGMYKTIFRQIATSGGRLTSDGKPEISSIQFQEYANKRGITDQDNDRTRPDAVSRVYLRCNVDHASAGSVSINYFDRRFMHPTALQEERERISHELSDHDHQEHETTMSMKDFLSGLIRCAHAKYDEPSLYLRWLRFVETNLPQKEYLMQEADDDVDQVLEWKQVQDVLVKHHNLLEGVFMHYCGGDFSGASSAAELISMKQWELFLKEAGLVGGDMTALEGKQIFVNVSLGDDLSANDNAADSSSELSGFGDYAKQSAPQLGSQGCLFRRTDGLLVCFRPRGVRGVRRESSVSTRAIPRQRGQHTTPTQRDIGMCLIERLIVVTGLSSATWTRCR